MGHITSAIESSFIASVSRICENVLSGQVGEEAARQMVWEEMEVWAQVASGETASSDDIHGKQAFLRGGDFDRIAKNFLSQEELSNLDRGLNRMFEVYDHDCSNICEGCELIMSTDYDDQFLITDRAIYCHKCAGEKLDERLCEVRGKIEKAESLATNNKTNIHNILIDWSVRLSSRTIVDALRDNGWTVETDISMFATRSILDRCYAEGIPHCTLEWQYEYPHKLAVCYKEEF